MSKKQPRLRLTFVLEADPGEGGLTNAVSDIRFSEGARQRETGDRLVRLALWSLKEYEKGRWESWEESRPAEEKP